jgi:hypothetical protein
LEEEPASPLATFNVSEFDIYQTKRKSLFSEANASICEPTRLRISSVESVTKQPNQKLQQTIVLVRHRALPSNSTPARPHIIPNITKSTFSPSAAIND